MVQHYLLALISRKLPSGGATFKAASCGEPCEVLLSYNSAAALETCAVLGRTSLHKRQVSFIGNLFCFLCSTDRIVSRFQIQLGCPETAKKTAKF